MAHKGARQKVVAAIRALLRAAKELVEAEAAYHKSSEKTGKTDVRKTSHTDWNGGKTGLIASVILPLSRPPGGSRAARNFGWLTPQISRIVTRSANSKSRWKRGATIKFPRFVGSGTSFWHRYSKTVRSGWSDYHPPFSILDRQKSGRWQAPARWTYMDVWVSQELHGSVSLLDGKSNPADIEEAIGPRSDCQR